MTRRNKKRLQSISSISSYVQYQYLSSFALPIIIQTKTTMKRKAADAAASIVTAGDLIELDVNVIVDSSTQDVE